MHFGETKPIGGVSDRAHSHPVLPAKAATHDLRRWSWVPGSPPLARGRPGRRSDGCREEPTCTCGRRGSIVCGLLFTMKIPTQACEPFASAAVNAQHRHPSLPGLTPQVGFTRLAAYNVSQLGQARVACNPSSSKKVFAKTDGPPGQARGRREPAESTGCACLLFSSCYVLLFGGHQLRETGARSSPFPVLFRCVTSKTRGGRFYPRSCFSPVIYRSRSGMLCLKQVRRLSARGYLPGRAFALRSGAASGVRLPSTSTAACSQVRAISSKTWRCRCDLVSPAQRKHSCANSRNSAGDAGMRAPASE